MVSAGMPDKPRPLPEDTTFYAIDNLAEPIQNDQAFNEIATAVLRLRATFQKHGFAAPVSIELGSHEDGYRMRHILPREMVLAYPTQPLRGGEDADPDVMFNIMGMEFRYPAKFRRERGKTRTL